MDRVYHSEGVANAQTFTCVPESVPRTRASPSLLFPAVTEPHRRAGRARSQKRERSRVAGSWGVAAGWGVPTGRHAGGREVCADPPRSFCPPSLGVYCLVILMSQCISNTLEDGPLYRRTHRFLSRTGRVHVRPVSSTPDPTDSYPNLDILIRG